MENTKGNKRTDSFSILIATLYMNSLPYYGKDVTENEYYYAVFKQNT